MLHTQSSIEKSSVPQQGEAGHPQVSSTELSRRMKALRKALKYKQEEFGAIFGGGQPMISQWENGAIKDYSSALASFSLLASYLADPNRYSVELERPVQPYSPILQSPNQLSNFIRGIAHPYPDDEWDLVLQSGSYFASQAPFKTSRILQNEHRVISENPEIFSEFKRPAPRTEDVLFDARVHGEAFVLHLQNRWSEPRYLKTMSELHENLVARAAGILLVKALVKKREEVVVDAFTGDSEEPSGESTEEFARGMIGPWVFDSDDAFNPLSVEHMEFNSKCRFAMNFLFCVLELIQVRLKSGDFALDDELVETLYGHMKKYIEAFSELGKEPVEDVARNQAAFEKVLTQVEGLIK